MHTKLDENLVTHDLEGKEALKKLKAIVRSAKSCLMLTALDHIPQTASPMYVQKVGDNASLYFLSKGDSERNLNINVDDRVSLYFQNPGKQDYLSIFGHAVVHNDTSTIERYWSDRAGAWFNGPDDPSATVIEVKPSQTFYWSAKDGKMLQLLKMSFAAITGKSVQITKEKGELNA